MQIQRAHLSLLATLLRDAQRGRRSSPGLLARRLGLTPESLRELLADLEGFGWADARRLRLTLAGLAIAVATRRRRRRGTLPLAA